MFDRGPCVSRADVVDQHPHVDAPFDRPTQRFGKHSAGTIVVEDIGCQGHRLPGFADRAQHFRIGLVAIDQRHYVVPFQQRPVRQFADHFDQRGQVGRMRTFQPLAIRWVRQ